MKKIFSEDSKEEKKSESESKENNQKNTRNDNLINKLDNKDEITCSSTSDEKDKTLIPLYNKGKSRFDFVDSNNNNEKYDVPQIFVDIINEKYKLKNIEHYFKNSDIILLNNKQIQKDIENNKEDFNSLMNENNNINLGFEKDEFELDFENINNFVLEQTSKI